MTREELDKHISQYLLLNVPAITNESLVYGKSGVALALGLYGLASNDEYLIDRSGDILTEALISRMNNPSFASGWAGIGWCTLRMMEHGLIEADYTDIMGDKHRSIVNASKINGELDIRSLIGLLQYLSAYNKVLKDPTLPLLQESLLTKVEQILIEVLMLRGNSPLKIVPNANITSLLECYLRYCIISRRDIPEEVLMQYNRLYAKGIITSSYLIGVYLHSVLGRESDYLKLIEDNLKYGELILRTMPIPSFKAIYPVLVAHKLSNQTNQTLEEYLLSHIGLNTPINEEKLLVAIRKEYSGNCVPVEIARILLYRYGRAEDIYV
ncbi:MAG: hypothetical protein HXN24_01135 [Porphyromonas sp.]|nr:hypothetical protein [Porphyromonas sp.]